MAIRDDDQHAAARTIEYPTALMLPIAIDWFCPAYSVVLMGRSQGRSLYVVVESSGGRQVSSLNACFHEWTQSCKAEAFLFLFYISFCYFAVLNVAGCSGICSTTCAKKFVQKYMYIACPRHCL